MSRLLAFGRFWWEFVIGDDWIVGAEIVVAVGVTDAVARSSFTVWWLLPVVVVVVLYSSLRRAVDPRKAQPPPTSAEVGE